MTLQYMCHEIGINSDDVEDTDEIILPFCSNGNAMRNQVIEFWVMFLRVSNGLGSWYIY